MEADGSVAGALAITSPVTGSITTAPISSSPASAAACAQPRAMRMVRRSWSIIPLTQARPAPDGPRAGRSESDASGVGERVAKALARAGVASRREVERLIEAGRGHPQWPAPWPRRAVKVGPLTTSSRSTASRSPPPQATRVWRYPQAGRPGDHPQRSQGTPDGVRQPAARTAQGDLRGPA